MRKINATPLEVHENMKALALKHWDALTHTNGYQISSIKAKLVALEDKLNEGWKKVNFKNENVFSRLIKELAVAKSYQLDDEPHGKVLNAGSKWYRISILDGDVTFYEWDGLTDKERDRRKGMFNVRGSFEGGCH